MLTLLSSAACAKLNLKPYEVPSASGTEVEILAPEVYLLYRRKLRAAQPVSA